MDITPELQAVIDAAVDEATNGLKNKNGQLLSENRTLKNAKTEAEAAAETATEEAQRKAGDIAALEKTLTDKHAKALKAVQDQLDAITKENTTFKVDSVITKALIDGNVSKGMIKPLEAMLKLEAQSNNLSGDDLATHVSTILKSDEAKAWIVAPTNIGTGSTGVRQSNGTNHGFTKENFSTRQGEWMKLAKDDPELGKSIAIDVGRSDLANTL